MLGNDSSYFTKVLEKNFKKHKKDSAQNPEKTSETIRKCRESRPSAAME